MKVKRDSTISVSVIENFDGFRGNFIQQIERKAKTNYAVNYNGSRKVYYPDGVKVSYKGKYYKVHFTKEFGHFISLHSK